MILTKDQINAYADPTWFPEPGRYLHLDKEYTNHYCLFFLNDGTIEDSRVKNWREVEWEKLDKIVVNIKGKTIEINPHPSNHKFFLYFRKYGFHKVYDANNPEGRFEHIRIWTVGVTDGAEAFLYDIDFHTGEVLQVYNSALAEHLGHIHPRIQTLNQIYNLIKCKG